MEEMVCPNSEAIMGQKERASAAPRLVQSPTPPFVLGSNDDQLERAKARAARAAAIRRKAVDVGDATATPKFSSNSCLDKEQIMELFQNCIKLASENKINQKNTWELKLIDHLSEIIKVETEENNAETNFQKASCTLEAGVKIYSLRVDSVHTEAYKVLAGISRAGLEDERETLVDGENVNKNQLTTQAKRETERKVSPLSTLETSFEALNVKKFDVAFAVDPLYHQTSAQFDEGGVKGLLLNNLGVYGRCQILFDSQEIPGKCISSVNSNVVSDMIDISFVKDDVEQMVMGMPTINVLCPTLGDIVRQFGKHGAQLTTSKSGHENFGVDEIIDDDRVELNVGPESTSWDSTEVEFEDGSFNNADTCSFTQNAETVLADREFHFADVTYENYNEEEEYETSMPPSVHDRLDDVAVSLLEALGFSSVQNVCAGPAHWKYRKSEGPGHVSTNVNGLAKRPKSKSSHEPDICFSKSLDEKFPDMLAAPKNPSSLLLPAQRRPYSNKLVEDFHYEPDNLLKFFLRPNVVCLGKRWRKFIGTELPPPWDDKILLSLIRKAEGPANVSIHECFKVRKRKPMHHQNSSPWPQQSGLDGPSSSWESETVLGSQSNDGYPGSDVEDLDLLVPEPRQVNRTEVQWDKTSKKVDVNILKATLWEHLQGSIQRPDSVTSYALSFRNVLATLHDECQAEASHDLSPHLCFICLLHLANEHGLEIEGSPKLDDLSIHLPTSLLKTGGKNQTSAL